MVQHLTRIAAAAFGLLTLTAANLAVAQTAPTVGSPEAAFAGGPIRLSKNAAGILRGQFKGDNVPIVPQPFRGRLDAALAGGDWTRLEAAKKDLVAARGIQAALLWEQTRFVATGNIGVAEMHARDLTATGSSAVSETAVMMWLYAAAVTFTDGRKCGDADAPDAHLTKLHGVGFDSVINLLKTLPADRVAAMRELAIRLETVLAPDRNDNEVCRTKEAAPDIKPDTVWRPEAVAARANLPKHLTALSAVMRLK